ncbi:MAG TPA: nuclear transport factor 2 family protein, partial [Lysobacter sp.]
LKITAPPDYARPAYSLVIYRVQDGLIRDLWHVARAESASVLDNAPARAVIEQLVDANNRGDVDAFLALFDRDARNLRRAEVPFRLSDELSTRIVDHDSRDQVFRAMFASGAPVQVEPIETLVFGDLVIAREQATKPDGQMLDELSIYRVRDGRILDDWFVAVVER